MSTQARVARGPATRSSQARPKGAAPWEVGPHPPTARPQVAAALGFIKGSLESLADALEVVAARHERNFEIHGVAAVLAGWMRDDIDRLTASAERYGLEETARPAKLRAAVLRGARGGLMGLLADLVDLAVLAEQVDKAWLIAYQGAKELEDTELQTSAGAGRDHAERVIRWIRTQIDHTAPEALAVGANPAASKRPA